MAKHRKYTLNVIYKCLHLSYKGCRVSILKSYDSSYSDVPLSYYPQFLTNIYFTEYSYDSFFILSKTQKLIAILTTHKLTHNRNKTTIQTIQIFIN